MYPNEYNISELLTNISFNNSSKIVFADEYEITEDGKEYVKEGVFKHFYTHFVDTSTLKCPIEDTYNV